MLERHHYHLSFHQFISKHNFILDKHVDDKEGIFESYSNGIYTVTVYNNLDDPSKVFIKDSKTLQYIKSLPSLGLSSNYWSWDQSLSS